MSDDPEQDDPQQDAPPADHEPDEPRSWKAALPFIIGGGLVLILLLWVLIVNVVRPTEDRLTDSAKVQHVVDAVYSARSTLAYDRYRDAFCDADRAAADFPDSVRFAAENRKANDADGRLVVPDMKVEVTGDRATATVTWHRENRTDEQKTTMTLVKVGDDWKVCSR
ncbi:hypothetical protein [Gordonia shandongensis]|uniref:Rv0361 family membrane protein n=1 Tax=Gordonia shandongensis TaxID=376351 RepID=UPI0003F98069|nr:hypothetical protein [Gordonia shandongensis]